MEKKLYDILGYTFKDPTLLKMALTHPSALPKKHRNYEFERLEFLGDRVLGLIIAEFVYSQYPDEREGVLARYQSVLVSRDICKKIGENIGLLPFIKYSLKDYQSKNTALIANTIEAVLGAIFLDGNLNPCKQFIYKHWKTDLIQEQSKDPKTLVQEWAQKTYNIVPTYTLLEKAGSEHSPIFTYQLQVEPDFESVGKGYNRKQAEQDAAQNFIEKYQKKMRLK
ncbi:MAG: ribonuclease III [Alphaproteobacteria bacterium]|nr:MAG: ribonuclease III [Alphaproteobacteria bacterium]